MKTYIYMIEPSGSFKWSFILILATYQCLSIPSKLVVVVLFEFEWLESVLLAAAAFGCVFSELLLPVEIKNKLILHTNEL